MKSIGYLYSKFFKKIIRWKSIIDSNIDKTASVGSGTSFISSSIGRHSYCGSDCVIDHVTIGAFCSISDNVYIGGAEHPIDWVSTSPAFHDIKHSSPRTRIFREKLPERKTTEIGNDVWIGHGVCIKEGVKVADGAVIAMGAVVTKDVEPYAVVAGVPAKIIKYRFDETTRQGLINSQWWNFSDVELAKAASFIKEPRLFLEQLNLNEK